MNRLITQDPNRNRPGELPPARREAGRTRVLFVSTLSAGFSTQVKQLKKYAGLRDDVDAVHLDFRLPLWGKVLAKRVVPLRAWDFCSYRILRTSAVTLNRWLAGPLPLERFDVVHVMTQGIAWPVTRFAGGRVKFAVHLDTTGTLETREHGFAPLPQKPFIAAERRMYAAADLVVPMSDWAGRSVRDDYGVPPDRIHVAPGCVTLPPVDPAVLEEKRRPGRKVKILFLANDWEMKGGPLLLRVHQRSLVGKAELHVVCATAPKERALPDVIWHGRVPWERVMQLVQSMDLFCNPTTIDMSPWSVVEAVTAGLPVVSTRMSAIPEMVLDGRTGYLCPQGDEPAFERALLKLVTDPGLRHQMSEATLRHAADRYNADRVYHGLMDRLIGLAQ